VLTGGQVHDCTQANGLLEQLPSDGTVKSVTADKAFDTNAILQAIEGLGAEAVIPSKETRVAPRTLNSNQYRNRNLIERFFCRIKQFRRIATRYDKLAERFSSFIAIAAAYIWLT
jgi:transposase